MLYNVPLYVQLRDNLLQRIKDGEYLPGQRIPSEREMSKIYKINRMTVKKAIDLLVEEGYLEKIQNRGTFVKRKEERRWYFGEKLENVENQGLSATVRNFGKTIENLVLENCVIENHRYIEEKLGLSKGEKVFALNRLRKVDGESLVLELCYLPFSYFEDISEYDFKQVSLYDYMNAKGHLPVKFKQSMTVQKVVSPFDKIMEIDKDEILYVLEYIGEDEEGNIVEYNTSYLRSVKAEYTFKINKI